MAETPSTVHGRLLEAVHISGYSFVRAMSELKWLLAEDRWRQVGAGFDDVKAFLSTVDFSVFKINIEERKEFAKLLKDIEVSQRATAKLLGVGIATVNRDLNVPNGTPEQKNVTKSDAGDDQGVPNGTPKQKDASKNNGTEDGDVKNLPPEWFQGVDPQRVAKKAQSENSKEISRSQTEIERKKLELAGEVLEPSAKWHIYHSDIRTWVAPRTYDFIVTDPPYSKEFLPLYEVLAQRSIDWLRDGGLLVVMCGNSYLNQILPMMDKHIPYYWQGTYLLPGQPTPLRQRAVNTEWKPLLMFNKGEYHGKTFGDRFESDANDKDFHKWGQSVSGMLSIVSMMCLPGQSILDPFCGAGTTGVAAVKHGCLFDGLDIDEATCKIAMKRIYDASNGTQLDDDLTLDPKDAAGRQMSIQKGTIKNSPKRAIDNRVTRSLDQLDNAVDMLEQFINENGSRDHPDYAQWLRRAYNIRTKLTQFITKEHGGMNVGDGRRLMAGGG